MASGSFPINICTVGYRRDWRNSVARHGRSRERTLVKKRAALPCRTDLCLMSPSNSSLKQDGAKYTNLYLRRKIR